jgi:hypothetical protein
VIAIRKEGKSVHVRNFVARSRAAGNLSLSLAVFLTLFSVSHAQQPGAPTGAEPSQQAESTKGTAAERETWRRALIATPRPTNGCYTATYPERQWREVPCKTPPTKLFLPRTRGTTQLDTVGGTGPDFTATVSGAITQAEGSFDSVTNVTATPAYSLQLNTDFFQTLTCNGSPNTSGCRGWEQFVYHSSTGAGVMQYWLINYGPTGTACPTPHSTQCDGAHVFTDGWCPITLGTSANPIYCVVNAAAAVPASPEPATSLGQLRVNGAAAGVNGATTDAMTVTVGGTVTAKNGNNYFSDLGSKWGKAEFNVFGDCCSEQVVFNSGASAVPRVEVDNGSSAGPGCLLKTWTAESSNLTLQNTPPSGSPGALPALDFAENNPASSGGPADCTDAVSLGDTHLTTFNGLHYDFQASGDFLLAEASPKFAVQTRQASGAPTWPNAAVNKAVATRMGKTTIALCVAPTRLLIDGAPRALSNHQSVSLPDDITLSRADDQYFIERINGDTVHARLNHGAMDWIDVSVYLGDRSLIPKVRGLLGNPDGDPNLIGMADGTDLKEPVSFEALYHRYGESWRVPQRESLLCKDGKIEISDPSKPFYASDLTEAQQAGARAICGKAGVKQPAALADCTLDVTVLGTASAALGLARAPIPRVVWQAGSRDYR